ncbi:tubulin polyglutamylase TTLL11 [Poecilia reticulata]|uniref:Tubulin tyrosine ligase-like family, member 11 n=1 Tax=Poecilia reticulata TaxID=8081 RepID=A0A3P9QD30_POERE|nr:PREDICTED: tubulin polyglutamylase TTLL11 [Poecilia reticulata]
MSDHYGDVKGQLGQMKSLGEDAEKEEVDPEENMPVSSPSASPDPASCCITAAPGTDALSTNICKQKVKRSGRNPCGKPLQGFPAHAVKNISSPICERTLLIKGTGKILQGKSAESNGNYAAAHESSNTRETRCEDEFKLPMKGRPVTVDTSKAKTSLGAVKLSIKELQWKEFHTGRRPACDIYWHGVNFHDSYIMSGQVNKFPGMVEMLRKINLSRAVRTMQELFPEEYDFYPRSWILPEEYEQFTTEVREGDIVGSPTYIVKPDGGSQGDGIYLIRDPCDLKLVVGTQVKQVVVQEYIDKPLLIDKLKFDIRLYVLIKSMQPLEIYIAKEGLTRFCTEPYQEPSQKNLNRVFMHLTNYSLNVQNGNYVHSDNQNTGSKRTLSSVLYRLSAKGVDIKRVWSDIIALVIKSVIAVLPDLKVHYQANIPPTKPGPTCFQILGFDILLMKNLKPVLLEVNSNPSMRIGHEKEVSPGVFEYIRSPVDEQVKVGVIRDTLRLMDPFNKKLTATPQPRGGGSDPVELIPVDGDFQCSPDDTGNLPPLCLKQVYPKYTKQFCHLRLVERIATLFIRFLRVKGNLRLGPTAFRNFIRTCKLSNSNFTMASVDILYIDITRRWSFALADSREAGMGLQAFVEVFFNLAGRRFKSLALRERVVSLLNLCESRLGPQSDAEERRSLSCSRALPRGSRTPALYLPRPRPISAAVHRRATSQDCRPHQRPKPCTLRANVEN